MKRLALVFVFALLVAACGGEQISEEIVEQAIGGDADVDISGEGDDLTVNIESDEGSLSFGSGASLPDELTIPVPDGGNVTAAGSQGSTAFAAVTYPQDRYDEIVAFYDSWAGDDWTTQTATLDISGQTQRSATWSSPDSADFVSVADCIDVVGGGTDFNAVCLTISQG